MYRTGPVLAAIALALALASCGGGGSSSDARTASTTGGITTSPASGGAVVNPARGTSSQGHISHGPPVSNEMSYGREPTSLPGGGPAGEGKVGATGSSDTAARAAGSTAACQARIGDLVDRMDDLRQSLLAGLDYSEYVLRVQAIRAAYEAVAVDRLSATCVAGPASDAESAFNQYLRAANLWGECAGTAGCAASSIESRLQHRWKLASKSLDAAKKPA